MGARLMGIFDIFTGDSAREAAEANQARLAASKTAGLGYLDAGKTGALGALTTAGDTYRPLTQKYGAATTLGLDALGVNGPEGNTRATQAFQAGPGYNWMVDQSLEGVARKANALGMGAGGNTLAALSDRAGNLANQEYGSWLDRLGGYVSPELSATAGVAGAEAGKAPVYMNDANQRVGLESNITQGMNSQETQAANAEMAGSKNLWGLGLGLAQLGVGAATGGTSLLGGLGGLGGGGPIPGGPGGHVPFFSGR
jgi:hypothetical protein